MPQSRRCQKAHALVSTVVLFCIIVALPVCLGCGRKSSESAAWKAVLTYIDARTPPRIEIKVTREEYLHDSSETEVEFRFVMAANTGLGTEVKEATAHVHLFDGVWTVTSIDER